MVTVRSRYILDLVRSSGPVFIGSMVGGAVDIGLLMGRAVPGLVFVSSVHLG